VGFFTIPIQSGCWSALPATPSWKFMSRNLHGAKPSGAWIITLTHGKAYSSGAKIALLVK
jgi:hypothetical protein